MHIAGDAMLRSITHRVIQGYIIVHSLIYRRIFLFACLTRIEKTINLLKKRFRDQVSNTFT